MNNESGLTDKQVRFCQEYIIDLNGTQAAIRAGYSEDSAKQIAAENLTKPVVSDFLDQLKRDRSKRLEIDADKVLAEIARLAFSDIRGIFTGSDGLKNIAALDADTAAAVQSVKVTKKAAGKNEDGAMEYDDVVEYKLADKKGPLEMLAKHLGEINQGVNVTHSVDEDSKEVLGWLNNTYGPDDQ